MSLAPADIPIDRGTEVQPSSPSEGLVVEVEPYANLDDLEFVQVILYTPERETPSADPD